MIQIFDEKGNEVKEFDIPENTEVKYKIKNNFDYGVFIKIEPKDDDLYIIEGPEVMEKGKESDLILMFLPHESRENDLDTFFTIKIE